MDPKTVSADEWLDGRVRPRKSPRPLSASEMRRVPRRYGQWAGSVLFVLVAVLVAGWLWQQKSDRVEVLSLAHSVPAGSTITRDDLTSVEVAGAPASISAENVSSVEGRTAAVAMVAGELLTPDMLTTQPVPGPGQRVVGVELDATRTPSGLVPGDIVEVLAAPVSGDSSSPGKLGSPTVLAERAAVVSAARVQGSDTRLTLLLPKADADEVATYGAAGQVTLVQLPLGGDG